MYKIIYAGTPEFALPALRALADSEHQVAAVYTQPDRPAGRGQKLCPGPVKAFALERQLTVCQPQDFKTGAAVATLQEFEADLMIVAAYGLLLPASVLTAPRLGCLNIHASLLPRWRGASPIQQAILAGDRKTGITLMKMNTGLDTGDIVSTREVTLDDRWTAGDLHDVLAPLGAQLLVDTLPSLEADMDNAMPQQDINANYAPRLTKQQALLKWNQPADQIDRQIRAYNPWPVSFTRFNGNNLRIWRAKPCTSYTPGEPGQVVGQDRQGIYISCLDSVLQATEIQLAGKNKWNAEQALNARDFIGAQLE
ncbi:MAG: methionyl-tRNA formyltransferase [Planctomycetota bacterium]|jgi:methionyl-tRNA formyltransferase